MEDYEDDAPWYGNLMICFPVYHDLNVRQLRGYFTWRTQIRKGHFSRTCSSFAYLYIYELLNGISTRNASDSFAKLQDFRHGYTDTDMGDITMKGNLRRWLFEFAVTYALPAETALRFVDADEGQHFDSPGFGFRAFFIRMKRDRFHDLVSDGEDGI